MKCPVCNETEVSPTKEGLIPDCSWCQNASNEAALISPTVGEYAYDKYDNYWGQDGDSTPYRPWLTEDDYSEDDD